MKPRRVLLGAILSVGLAQGVRAFAREDRDYQTIDVPYAPSPGAARFVSAGYREAFADVLFFRLVGYFGSGERATPEGVAGLAEAIAALDPHFRKIYAWGARAMVAVVHEQTPNEISMRAIQLLETGAKIYPDDYQLPLLAGEIYLFDLRTKSKTQRREWDEKAARLLEAAVRKPKAPVGVGTVVAHLQTKLGAKQRAIDNLRELILITDDDAARKTLIDKLAELEDVDAAEIASELITARKQFEAGWRRDRFEMPPSLYILIGPPTTPGFDMRDLATGGRNLVELGDTNR